MKYDFTFSDWERRDFSVLPPEISDILKNPEPYRPYRPAWGKYSTSAEKASITKARKSHERNKEVYFREVFPIVRGIMTESALFDTAIALRSAEIMALTPFRYWTNGSAGAWIRVNDPRENTAESFGAKPIPHENAFSVLYTNP